MMYRYVLTAVLLAFLWLSTPAQAQLRQEVPRPTATPFKLLGNKAGLLLNQLFSPQHFAMKHSYEVSYSSMGGSGLMAGIYTNTMLWQFGSKLAARVDIGLLHTPMATGVFRNMVGGNATGKLFLRNAEITYRPGENVQLHFSIRQSPYGAYMNPYGYVGGYRSQWWDPWPRN